MISYFSVLRCRAPPEILKWPKRDGGDNGSATETTSPIKFSGSERRGEGQSTELLWGETLGVATSQLNVKAYLINYIENFLVYWLITFSTP